MPKFNPVTQTTKQIAATADELEQHVANLRMLTEWIERAGYSQLDAVGSTTELNKALSGLDSYWAACKKALTEQKKKRGDFTTPPDDSKSSVRKPRLAAEK